MNTLDALLARMNDPAVQLPKEPAADALVLAGTLRALNRSVEERIPRGLNRRLTRMRLEAENGRK